MARVMLADTLTALLRRAAHRSTESTSILEIGHLISALLEEDDPVSLRLARSLAPTPSWVPSVESAPDTLGIALEHGIIPLEGLTTLLLVRGAESVLLGSYEPRHLAFAIGEYGSLSSAPLSCLGFDSRVWRQTR